MRKTVAYAFHHSIPILIGFFPVGLAYGLLCSRRAITSCGRARAACSFWQARCSF